MADDSLYGKGSTDQPLQSTSENTGNSVSEMNLDSAAESSKVASAATTGTMAAPTATAGTTATADTTATAGTMATAGAVASTNTYGSTADLRDNTGKLAAENAEERKAEEEENIEKQQKNLKQTKRQMRAVRRFLFHAFLLCFLLWIMFGVVFGILRMPTSDMTPRIDNGDLLMYYRLDKGYKADQVVVLEKNETTYVGRVVAVSGDTVEITDEGKLIINGNAVIEQRITTPTPRYEGFVEYPVKLGNNEYFILTDVRDGGEDSRYYGVVGKSEIKGSVFSLFRRNHF